MTEGFDSVHSRRLAIALVLALLLPAAGQTREAPGSFADLAEKLLPSVVNVSTTQTIRNPERVPEMPQFPPGSPFEDFFKEFFDRQMRPDAHPRRATSLGSGFIIDASGYVVTNNHVIADADEITVTLHDDTVVKASVVGRDSKTDLALLKIDAGKKALTAATWGNSDGARIGDWVLAIGNPFGMSGTVTTGIVSARARELNGPYDDFIQTDAPINRGNSGGPLFNMNGEVIGINSAIFSPSGGSIGIGFAIPSSLAKPVIEDLKKFGKTRRGWLGVRIQSLDKELAESMGLSDEKGALVAAVNDGSPAAKAGLKPGDVILKFDGKDVSEMRRLPRLVAETAIGRKSEVVVWRDGRRHSVEVVIGELEDDQPEVPVKGAEKPSPQSVGQAVPGTGMSVANLTPQLRERFGIDGDTKGVVVTEVKGDGAAADKGLKAGDVVIEAGNQPVRSPQDLIKMVEKARGAGQKSLLLRVENPQNIRFVALPLGKK
ncbi:MAG: DegQ family serine endoprotease [Magnetospirillum sp.]|nr:DegQ family serine endoprotease [Magnetospirillum sp.]